MPTEPYLGTKREVTTIKHYQQENHQSFDWPQFMDHLMKDQDLRIKIGPGWLLLFDIYRNADISGFYSSTYQRLAKRYGVATITVKKWRQHLCRNNVIESFSRGHSVAFRLKDLFLSYLRPRQDSQDKQSSGDMLLKLLTDAMQRESALKAA